MEKIDNNTDRFFRDRLWNFEQSPPDTAWDSISAKLESRKKKRTLLVFFRIAAGMALLISSAIGIYYVGIKDKSSGTGDLRITEVLNDAGNNEFNKQDAEPVASVEKHSVAVAGKSGRTGGDNNAVTRQTENSGIEQTGSQPVNERENQPIESQNEQLPLYPDQPIDQIDTGPEIITERQENLMASGDSIRSRTGDLPAMAKVTPEQAKAELLAVNDVSEAKPEKPRRWIIGSEIAPLYSNRNIRSDGDYSSAISSMNSSETGVLAYAGGVRVAVDAGKRLTVQSGIYYSRYGQQINDVKAITGYRENEGNKFIAASNSTGSIEGVISARLEAGSNFNSLDNSVAFIEINRGVTYSELKPLVEGDEENIQLRQYFDYFELPLILRYKVIDRKMDLSFSGGLITNLMVGNTVSLIADGDSRNIGETTEVNQINYLGSFGLGVEMPISGNFSFSIEPRFRYYINSIDQTGIISVHPYSFGFFAGVNYRF